MGEKNKVADITAIVAKGGLGAIPFIGPLAAEIVGGIIPNQRLDRLEDTVRRLEAMLEDDEKRLFESKMDDPEFIDLFEEAMLQAARSLSGERRENIAKLLKKGMTDEERGHQTKRRLFEVFERVNDTEIIILIAKAHDPNEEPGFWDTHESILFPPKETIGSPLEPDEAEAALMHEAYLRNLVSQGLFRPSRGTTISAAYDMNDLELTAFGRQMVKYLVDDHEVDFE